jgi:hypothetical protein
MTPDYPKQATPAQVWNEASRTLTGITGQPRSDLLGEDATFEAGVATRKAKIDNVDATVSTRAKESGGRLDGVPAFVAATESSVLMDGTEKTLIEITDIKSSEIEAWADLTPMAAGDTIVVRYSRKMKAAGSYAKYAEETYSGAQAIPALCIINKKVYRDIKITAQQTAIGVYRTIDVQVIRAKEA